MAIKKIVVAKDKLPKITSEGKYYLRYRIISDDKSLNSAWSVKHEIIGKKIEDIVGTPLADIQEPDIVATTNGLAISWDLPNNLNKEVFDVFLKWSYDNDSTYDTEWAYFGTVSSNTTYAQVSYFEGTRATHAKARIQIESTDKVASDVVAEKEYVLVAESVTGRTTVVSFDGGTIGSMV